MTGLADAGTLADRVNELSRRRSEANRAFFAAEAERLARCCHQMAERFARGGRLVAFGRSPAARSDARHVAVEFVHPVIVGKRALPAIGLAGEGGELAAQVGAVAEPDDVAIAFGAGEHEDRDGEARAALAVARERGCQTISFAPAGAEWEFEPQVEDPFVAQELVETLYHVLWELVHVFFDHRGLLSGREARPVHDTGGSSFLYPFLSESEHDLDAITDDVRRSVLMKSEEVGALREQTLGDGHDVLIAAAAALRERFDSGGKLLAFGNGGSATDAMDAVADFRRPPAPPPPASSQGASAIGDPGSAGIRPGAGGPAGVWPVRPALDLTEDSSILTAVANDVGVEEIFQRQVIAYGREVDAALAFSTSGGSDNIISALAEARRRGLLTIAMVGYDGGRIAAEGLAEHVVITRSQHIPRIQEAQASAYHVLRELVELAES